MTQPELFGEDNPLIAAVQAGIEGALACTQKADAIIAGWSDSAYAAICWYARLNPGVPWTAEDCTEWAQGLGGVPAPHDERAWGSIFTRAARAGVIVRSDLFYKRRKGHGTEARKWLTAQ